MDEVRRFRFFIPVSIFIVTLLLLSPDTFKAGVTNAMALIKTTSNDQEGFTNALVPTAATLALGTALAIGLGFVNSTIANFILQFCARPDSDFRITVRQQTLDHIDRLAGARPDIQIADLRDRRLATCSTFQHTAPEQLKAWMARRWEMFIVSVNCISAIVFAWLTAALDSAPKSVDGPWAIAIFIFTALLWYCALRAHREIGAMTEYLAYCDNWKWPPTGPSPIAVLPPQEKTDRES
jgi:hypothetical protein